MEALKRAFKFQTVKKILRVKNIHENSIPNVKHHVISTFLTKYNKVRVVPNTSLHQNSILNKKRNILKKHNSGFSTLPERSDNQIKINICTEEENFLEVLSGVDHRRKGHRSRQGNMKLTLMNIFIR